MTLKLYDELSAYYRALTPPEDYADEAALYFEAMRDALGEAPKTLLELGAGAGHNAVHLKHDVRCTLTDVSGAMLELSRELNPECEHVVADMRTLRLGRAFDLVFVHDAVMYMVTEHDLRAAMTTAYEHLRPGGVALFAPDDVEETFEEGVEVHETGPMCCLEWAHDPDPTDRRFVVDFAFLLRDEAGEVRSVHDRHHEGLFPREEWLRWLSETGFEVSQVERDTGDDVDSVFVCRRA